MQMWVENEKGLVRPESGGRWLTKESIKDQINEGRIKLKKYLPPLDRIRKNLQYDINRERDKLVASDVVYKNTIFEADSKSCTNMKEKLLEISLLDTSAEVVWIDKNDNPVKMTHDEFKELLLIIGRRKDAAYILANTEKRAIQEMSREDLSNYDVFSIFK